MPKSHAAPVTTITDGEVRTDSQLMVGRREEAQRLLDRELNAGPPPRSAVAMAGRAFEAVSRVPFMPLAGLPYAIA